MAVDRSEYEAELREQQHLDDVMRRLADPSTPEGVVAQKAYRRIAELLEELKLDEGHLSLATEACFNPVAYACKNGCCISCIP